MHLIPGMRLHGKYLGQLLAGPADGAHRRRDGARVRREVLLPPITEQSCASTAQIYNCVYTQMNGVMTLQQLQRPAVLRLHYTAIS